MAAKKRFGPGRNGAGRNVLRSAGRHLPGFVRTSRAMRPEPDRMDFANRLIKERYRARPRSNLHPDRFEEMIRNHSPDVVIVTSIDRTTIDTSSAPWSSAVT